MHIVAWALVVTLIQPLLVDLDLLIAWQNTRFLLQHFFLGAMMVPCQMCHTGTGMWWNPEAHWHCWNDKPLARYRSLAQHSHITWDVSWSTRPNLSKVHYALKTRGS